MGRPKRNTVQIRVRMTSEEEEMLRELKEFFRLRSVPEAARYVIRSAWTVVKLYRAARSYKRKRGEDHARTPATVAVE